MPDKLVLGHFTFTASIAFLYQDRGLYEYAGRRARALYVHATPQMLFLMVLTVFQRVMPFSQVFENFRFMFSCLSKKFTLIQIDNYMKRIQSTIFLTGSRQHLHFEQLAQQW